MKKTPLVYEPLGDVDRRWLASARARVQALRGLLPATNSALNDEPVALVQAILDADLVRTEDTFTQEALGVVLGDHFAELEGFRWERVTDPWGAMAALVDPKRESLVYPIDWIAKRFEENGVPFDVATWFASILEVSREGAATARRR